MLRPRPTHSPLSLGLWTNPSQEAFPSLAQSKNTRSRGFCLTAVIARAGPCLLLFHHHVGLVFWAPAPHYQSNKHSDESLGSTEASHPGVIDLSHAPQVPSRPTYRVYVTLWLLPGGRGPAWSEPSRAWQILGWFVNPVPGDIHHSCHLGRLLCARTRLSAWCPSSSQPSDMLCSPPLLFQWGN